MSDQLIPLALTHSIAWYLRNKISPGQFIHPAMEMPYAVTSELRKKINEAILYFAEHSGEGEVPPYWIEVTPEEAWCIDLWTVFDGPGNEQTTMLYQLFQGLAGEVEPDSPLNLPAQDMPDIGRLLDRLDE